MADQEVDGLAVDEDWHVPVALGRQPEDVELVGGVPIGRRGRRRVVGQPGAGHVLPEEVLEGPDVRGVDWVLGQDEQAELSGEEAEAEGVVGAAHHAVVVEVEPGRYAGVGRCDEQVVVTDRLSAVLRHLEVVGPEQVRGHGVEVELVDQQHLRPGPLDDLRDRCRLGIAGRREVGAELTRKIPVERSIEGREPHGVVVAVLHIRLRRQGKR